jgi:hypothetical protein
MWAPAARHGADLMYARALGLNLRIALWPVLAGLLGACGTIESIVPSSSRTQSGVETHVGPGTSADKIVVLPVRAEDLECPVVEIEDGAATARVGGPENAAVRYQFDLDDTARECEPRGDQFSLKVGVSGRLLIGPAGAPGAYSTNVKVLVRREVDQKTVFEKTYRVEANTAGGDQAPFRVVTEPIMLPLTRAQLNDDYSIFAGFDNGKNVAMERPLHHRKPKQEAATPASQ